MPVESAHFKIVTYLSKQCHTFCKGLLHTLRNGVLYAKSFYKCCLQTYFPFIIYREHIAWIGACFDCTFPKITIAYVEGNPCRDVVCTFLKQCCTLCKGLLRLFVVLFLKLIFMFVLVKSIYLFIYVWPERAIGDAQWLLVLQKQQCLVLERTEFTIVSRFFPPIAIAWGC